MAVAVGLSLGASVAGAPMETASTVPASLLPRARLSLAVGGSYRDARQNDGSLPIRLKGFAPTQLRLAAAYFFGRTPFGLAVDLGGEWFVASGTDLQDQPVRISQSVLRGFAAVAGRWGLPWGLTIEAQLGYGAGQLPGLDVSSGDVLAAPLTHHGPVFAASLAWEPGRLVALTARGVLEPFAVSASAAGGAVGLWEYTAGLELAVGRLALASFQGAALLDYELSSGQANRPGFSLVQTSHRLGVGFRVRLIEAPALVAAGSSELPNRRGRIRGRISFADGPRPGASVPGVMDGRVPFAADAQGNFVLEDLDPGKVTLSASASGYKPTSLEIEVAAGADASVSLVLEKPTGPGTIRGLVRSSASKGPLAGIPIQVMGAAEVRTGPDGAFAIAAVGPGPVTVKIAAAGFAALEETVLVPPEGVASLELGLTPLGQARLAVVRGLVRTTAGAPVRAAVRIRETGAASTAGADGRFTLRLPGGQYTVLIEAAGFVSQTKRVEVADGDEAIFQCELEASAR